MLTLTASARSLRRLKPQRFLASLPHVVEHDGTLAERSLILLKPDAVERRLVGRILSRGFRKAGTARQGCVNPKEKDPKARIQKSRREERGKSVKA